MGEKQHFLSRAGFFVTAAALLLIGLFMYFALQYESLIASVTKQNLARSGNGLYTILLQQKLSSNNVEELAETISHLYPGYTCTLINEKGTVVADSNLDIGLFHNLSTYPEIEPALDGIPKAVRRYSYAYETTMYFYSHPLPQNIKGAEVFRIGASSALTENFADNVYRNIVLAGFIVFIFFVAIGILLIYLTTGPYNEIFKVIRKYKEGDFNHHLYGNYPILVAQLANELNDMSESLNRRMTTLTSERNEYETILTNMTEPVIMLDKNLLIEIINPAAYSLFKKESDNVVGKSLIEVFRNTELNEFAQNILKEKNNRVKTITVTEKQQENYKNNFSTSRVQREYHLQIHGTIISPKADNNNINIQKEKVLLVLNDITAIKNLEKIRKDFVSNVSHELKTPLTSIKGYVETLIDGALHSKQTAETFLQRVNSQVNRLQAIVDDLLSLSRLEQDNRKNFDFKTQHIGPIVVNAINACSRRAEEKGIEISQACSEQITCKVNTLLIEQAIINLIDNAIKYSDNNSKVEVTCAIEKKWVDIIVTDSGNGIPRKDLERIFERFYRVDKARSRAQGGTGLGLAIVKHIAITHNGEIYVESILDEGSSFHLRLPYVQENA